MKTETDPYIFQILTQNWTHIYTKNQKFAPILRNLYKIYVKFANILEILFETFSKIGFWKKLRPIDLPKFKFEKGSFIY